MRLNSTINQLTSNLKQHMALLHDLNNTFTASNAEIIL